jgi:hypothetical protein
MSGCRWSLAAARDTFMPVMPAAVHRCVDQQHNGQNVGNKGLHAQLRADCDSPVNHLQTSDLWYPLTCYQT